MRNLTLFVVAFLAANLSFAQKGIEIGLEFTPAVTFILNDNDFAEGDALNFRGTFGYNTGLSLGYNFNDGIGIASGVIISRQGQNYITDFSGITKANQNTFSRQLSYIRVPLLLKFNGDPNGSSSSYFRIGPHFDFLSGARYKYENKQGVAYSRDVNLLKEDGYFLTGLPGSTPANELEIYKKFVFGVTLEFGGSANINEYLKLTFMLHLSGNLNSEGADAARLAGAPYFMAYPADVVTGVPPTLERAGAFNVMGGINVGFRYTILMD